MLPLAIGIAGRLVQEMSVEGDWAGVVAVLREEFGEGSHTRTMEENVIASSLRSISGSQKANVLVLFKALALVPEDTWCGLR